jgi:hypothetical protein
MAIANPSSKKAESAQDTDRPARARSKSTVRVPTPEEVEVKEFHFTTKHVYYVVGGVVIVVVLSAGAVIGIIHSMQVAKMRAMGQIVESALQAGTQSYIDASSQAAINKAMLARALEMHSSIPSFDLLHDA